MTAVKIFLFVGYTVFLFCMMGYWYYKGVANGIEQARKIIQETQKKYD